jgi:RHS repeat-associated protein
MRSKTIRGQLASILSGIVFGSICLTSATASPIAPNESVDAPSGATITLLPSGARLVLGGLDQSGKASATGTIGIEGESSSSIVQLKFARMGHTATVLPNGKVLVLGGVGGDGHVVHAIELFDPSNSESSLVSQSTLRPRTEHTATVMTDGRVLIAGGLGEDGAPLADVDVLDSVSGLVEHVNPKMQAARFGHLASLLPSSPVLVLGGLDAHGRNLGAAELYDPTTNQFVAVQARDLPRLLSELDNHAEPAMAGGIPTPDTVDFPVDGILSVRFSKRLQMQSLNAETVVLYGPLGMVKVKVVPVEAGSLVFITPGFELQPGASYTLLLNGPIDSVGQRLPFSSVRFKTATLPDGLSRRSAANALSGGISGTPGVADASAGNTDATHGAQFTEASRTTDGIDDEEWIPGPQNFQGNWRTARNPPSLSTKRLPKAAFGVTALSGRVLRLNGKPLANVTLSIGEHKAQSDADGYFLLTDIPAGTQTLIMEGATANRPGAKYGYFESVVKIARGESNELPYTIWMPKLDTKHVITIPSPTTEEVVISSPRIPGFEVRIPAGVVLRDRAGKIVTEVGITPVPLDRATFPQPMDFPAYYTVQPGGVVVQSVEGQQTRPARLVYPNYTAAPPGTTTNAWLYDPAEKGWYIYGHGRVSRDGKVIEMDREVGLYEFTASAHSFGPDPGRGRGCPFCPGAGGGNPDARGGGSGSGKGAAGVGKPGSEEAADPVSLSTGIFVQAEEDLVVEDLNPISVLRVYRHTNANLEMFGHGWSSPLNWYLWKPGDGTKLNLVLPNGVQVEYVNTTGTGCCTGVYKHTSSPGVFYNSTMYVMQGTSSQLAWKLTLKDGRSYFFAAEGGGLISYTDRFGNKTTITRNQHSQSVIDSITRITGPTGRWIAFTLNTDGTVAQMTDSIGRTYSYSYQSGYLQSVTDPAGGVRQYSYDSNNRLRTITDETNNVIVTNDYDANGRVSQQTYANSGTMQFAYTLDVNGKVTQTDVTDQRGNIRRVSFDSRGYITSSTYPVGTTEAQTTTFSLDSGTGRLLSSSDQLGRTTTYTYDAAGNVASITNLYGTANASTTTYTYEPYYYQLATVTDPLNHTWTIGYDAAHNPTTTTDPLGHTITRVYNSVGQVTSVTDANNHATTFTYAGADLVQATDALGRSTNYSNDAVGRRAFILDALGQVTKLEYDGRDRLTTRTEPNGSTITYTYDDAGRLTGHRDQNTNLTSYGYGNLGLLTTRTDALTHVESRAYDIAGMLAQVTDRKGQVSGLTYDNRNRLSQIGYGATTAAPTSFASTIAYTYDAADRATQIADSTGGTITRTYDGLDRLTQEQTPEGTVTYTYDAAGRRSTMTVAGQPTVTYAWDNANRVTSITQGSDVVTFTYDNANRRTSTTLPNGVVTSYGYDNAGQITSITYVKGGTAIGDLTYTYDGAGRRTAVGGSLAAVDLPSAVTSVSINANNQITAWAGTTLSYDLNGNLTGDGSKTYAWTPRDELASISGAVSASFAYDAIGRRRSKTIAASQTAFLYDGLDFVQELSGASVTANLITGGMDEPFIRRESTVSSYPVGDALGNLIALTDVSGTIQTQYSFEPYGQLTTSGAGNTNSQKYTGREDDGTGLLYYRARYYHPGMGRFVSEDPIGLRGGPNAYAYVAADPISRADPLGLLFTNLLNGVSRDPIDPGAASGISNFSSAVTLGGAAAIAGGAGLASGGGAGAAAIGDAAGAGGALVCRAAKELKNPCRNVFIATLLGAEFCAEGRFGPDSLRKALERREEIRRASNSVRRDSAGSSSPGP